ncbi:FAD-dependent monooxygenase [Amycolatopsis samaneae]|uniref:FAD-dependent monooxygenase n=1 Tax=Amycolatopsis samaneae TaxID=664691 RepID=A0ABW5GMF0_9PSEU
MATAVVIGGGIAGAASAIALRKAGIAADVHEAHPHGADDLGAFLTIMHNGMDALRAVDAHRGVIAASFPAADVEFYAADGRLLSRQPMGSDRGELMTPRTIRRAGLYRALHDELRARGGEVFFGRRLREVRRVPGGVRAVFEDGTVAEGDLVVGADGIHSRARALLDPDAPPPRHTGLTVVYGYAADAPDPAPAATYRMITGSRAYFGYTTDPDGCSWWFARLPCPELTPDELRATPPGAWRERTAAFFRDDETPAARIIAATGDDVRAGSAYDVPTTRRWHDGSLVLVGDAAHAASPAAGQGASMALEDAVVLAQCVRDLGDAGTAFATYEALRRERVERLVAVSSAQGVTQTSAEEVDQRPRSRAWLYEHHLDWDATVGTG